MILEKVHHHQRSSILPLIPRYSDQRNQQQPNTQTSIQALNHASSTQLNSDRDFTSKSLKLKSQRNYQSRLLSDREKNAVNCFKGTYHQSLNERKSQIIDKFANQKQMETFSKQTKITQFYTKNSLMNKILSHHKKVNKINFQDSRSQLFGNFHKNNIYLSQNITQIKPSLESPNEKIISLLKDQPFKKASPLKYNISKLKRMNNIKNLAKKNILLSPSFNQVQFEENDEYKSQRQTNCQVFTSNLKINKSLTFIEKPFIKTDILKGIAKSFNKLERFSSLENGAKQKRKKSLLMISDDEKSQKNLSTIVSEFQQKPSKRPRYHEAGDDNKSRQYHKNQKYATQNEKQNEQQNLQIKFQQRILSDLIRLEQMKNKQCYAENKVLRLKSSRQFAKKINQVKIQAKDKEKLRSHKIKYLVKFKTEPKQNPQEKLEAKLSRIIPEIQTLRNKLLEETKFQREQISGFAQPLNQRSSEIREKTVMKESRSLRKTKEKKVEVSFLDKQVTGWDFQNQIEGKESWNFRL